jgi:hypothetical protein
MRIVTRRVNTHMYHLFRTEARIKKKLQRSLLDAVRSGAIYDGHSKASCKSTYKEGRFICSHNK